jgi:ABC-type nitrate/sulfonate/bicarbonate transport system substrate-binding protein
MKWTMKMKRLAIVMACLLVPALLAACGGARPGESETEDGGAGVLRDVTLILDYLPNTNHTGIYVAKALGYYEETGLAVEIEEPAENAVTTLVATGRGDFGISYQEDVTYARTAADPLPIKAIAAVIQHNTSGFASHSDKNILRPKDFEGKTYAGWGSPSEEAVIKAVMTADGGDFSTLNIVTGDGSGYASLAGRTDLIWIFWAWDGIAAERDGVPLNYIELRRFDRRLDYYTPVIIAADALLAADPALARDFLSATRRGYEYSAEHPEEAARVFHEYAPEYELDMLTESQIYLSERYTDDAESWGLMKDSVWNDYTAFMEENGLISARVLASDCYTNEFLQAED